MIKLTPALAGDQKELYEFSELKPKMQDVVVNLYRKSLINSDYVVDKEAIELQLKDDKEVERMIKEYEPLFTEYGTVSAYSMPEIREAEEEIEVIVYWAAECRVNVNQELADLTEEEFNHAFPAASISYDAFRLYTDNAEYIDLGDLEEDYIVRDYINSGENVIQFFKNEREDDFHVDTDFYFECFTERGNEIQWDNLDEGMQEKFIEFINEGNFSGNFYAYDYIEVIEKEITLTDRAKAAQKKLSQREPKTNNGPSGREER